MQLDLSLSLGSVLCGGSESSAAVSLGGIPALLLLLERQGQIQLEQEVLWFVVVFSLLEVHSSNPGL